MQIPAEKADDTVLDAIQHRLAASKDATLTRDEAILLLAHIRHQDERIEELAFDRDTLKDMFDDRMANAN